MLHKLDFCIAVCNLVTESKDLPDLYLLRYLKNICSVAHQISFRITFLMRQFMVLVIYSKSHDREISKIWRKLKFHNGFLSYQPNSQADSAAMFWPIYLCLIATVRWLLYPLFWFLVDRKYCSFSLLHYSFYYTYCLKKKWIALLIFITVLVFLLYVLF